MSKKATLELIRSKLKEYQRHAGMEPRKRGRRMEHFVRNDGKIEVLKELLSTLGDSNDEDSEEAEEISVPDPPQVPEKPNRRNLDKIEALRHTGAPVGCMRLESLGKGTPGRRS